ncbi:MAG: hypothetical protein DMG71_16735 [Acidobacteria bacterium]|nr:MAG: hypothetical protein DMG71_16735 [Acidobacteriota bacterium]
MGTVNRSLWSFFLALFLAAQAFAQGGATGAITGTVQDPSGAVVAGADVRIVNQDTGVLTRSLKTDANGVFTATLLPVGTYTVSINSGGFQEAKFTDIAVRVTETTRMNARMAPLKVLEKVGPGSRAERRYHHRHDRGERRSPYHPQPPSLHPELSTTVDPLFRNQFRTERLRLSRPWRRSHPGQWPARRQQQLLDRRNQRH